MKWKKVYVKVIIEQDSEGNIRPMSIVWTDGHTYEVDRLKQKCRAASLKVGGTGIRYTVMICGKETYLYHEFYEDEGKWFVEAKLSPELRAEQSDPRIRQHLLYP